MRDCRMRDRRVRDRHVRDCPKRGAGRRAERCRAASESRSSRMAHTSPGGATDGFDAGWRTPLVWSELDLARQRVRQPSVVQLRPTRRPTRRRRTKR
eukprot:3524839-Prymnesium_polylepis.1